MAFCLKFFHTHFVLKRAPSRISSYIILQKRAKPLFESKQSVYHSCTRNCLLPAASKVSALGNVTDHRQANLSFKRSLSLKPQVIYETAPEHIKPYLNLIRFDKPIGTLLLYWPCTWSIALAAQPGHLPDVQLLLLFAMGAFLMRGAGCIINDLWDRDFDRQVERTKSRPLAAGTLQTRHAAGTLLTLLSASLSILLSFNEYSIGLGLLSMVLVSSYPLMKRLTYWPQAFLGLTFNWGCLLGWAAVHGSCCWSIVLPLYAGGIFWTLIYDTIYGHQDKEDDALIGLKSTSLLFGERTQPVLLGFTAVMSSCLLATGFNAHQTWPFFLGVAAVTGFQVQQITSLKINDPADCGRRFRLQNYVGILLLAAIVASTLLRTNR